MTKYKNINLLFRLKLIGEAIIKSNEFIVGVSLGTMTIFVITIALYTPSPIEKSHNVAPQQITNTNPEYQAPERAYSQSNNNISQSEITL